MRPGDATPRQGWREPIAMPGRDTIGARFPTIMPPHGQVQATLTVDLLVSGVAILTAVAVRIMVEQMIGGVTPFVLTFPAVIAATLFAGARAGAMAAIGCQILTIRYVFPHWLPPGEGASTDLANIVLSTLSLALTIWATASYRSAAATLRRRCRREVETLSLLIGEMDHRTKNNFQIAASLLADQARGVGKEALTIELDHASARLSAIASVYRNLGLPKADAQDVLLGDYLGDVVALLRDGVARSTISLSLACDAIRIPAHDAMMIGLIVNEWITNATKYAFRDAQADGTIDVAVRCDRRHLWITVRDSGASPPATMSGGTGSRLVAGLAESIHGGIAVTYDHGLICTLTVPRS